MKFIKKRYIALLTLLSSVSLVGTGFSSWVYGTIDGAYTLVDASVSDVIVGKSLSKDYKFTASFNYGIDKITNTYTRNSISYTNNTYSDYLCADLNVNIKNSELFFNQNYDSEVARNLIIKLTIKDNNGNIMNKNNSYIDGCFISPKRFDNTKFNIKNYGESIDTFYLPFKSKLTLSLFQIAMYDKSYSPYSATLYMSPVSFSFSYKESLIHTSITNKYIFNVEFSVI